MENSFFEEIVEKALDISKSGRWALFNERIEALAQSCESYKAWRTVVLSNIAASVFSEFLELKKVYQDEKSDVSLMAWRARNLLELSIWSIYITQSEENAKKFEDDAAKDTLDVMDAFTKWGVATAQDEDWLDMFKTAKEDIKQKAQSREVGDLESSYQRVDRVAEAWGMGSHYKISNKVLSKFAHPTAMQILGAHHDETITQGLKDLFYGEGCLFFHGAFEILDEHLKSLT